MADSHEPLIVPVPDKGPRCKWCNGYLTLTPRSFGEPSVDAMNLAAGVPVCQHCLKSRLRAGQSPC